MSRRARWALTVATICVIAINAVLVYAVTRHEWAPLGPYPTQTVELPRDGIPTPAISNDRATAVYPTLHVRNGAWSDLPVAGEKCADETVTVTGEVSWRAVEPPGTQIGIPGAGTAVRTSGCTKFRYENRVPDPVRARVAELAATGRTVTLWEVGGTETPIGDDGQTGAKQPWRTETFAIVWEAA